MSKKVLSLVLALVMVLGTFGTVFAEEPTVAVNEKIQWLIDQGIVTGNESGDLMLDKTIDRASVAKMVVEALDLKAVAEGMKNYKTAFNDVPVTHWSNGNINVVAGRGLMIGNAGNFMPGNQISYAEVITILVRMLEGLTPAEEKTAVWPTTYIAKAHEMGILDGVTVASYQESAVREAILEMFYNAMVNRELGNNTIVKAIVLENNRVEAISSGDVVVEIIREVQRSNYVDKSRFEKGDQERFAISAKVGDVEEMLGKVYDFTLDRHGNVINAKLDTTYTYYSGGVWAISNTKLNNYTVELSERYREKDERIFRTYHNDKSYSYEDFVKNVGAVDYARVTVKNGKVLYVDSYTFDDIAPVKQVKRDGLDVYVYNDYRDAREEKFEPRALVIGFKDGKFSRIERKDIKANDVVHVYQKSKMIVRQDAVVEGTYLKVERDKYNDYYAHIDEEAYYIGDGDYFRPVYAHDSKAYTTLYAASASSNLAQFYKKNVTALKDINDGLQLIGSDIVYNEGMTIIEQILARGQGRFMQPNNERLTLDEDFSSRLSFFDNVTGKTTTNQRLNMYDRGDLTFLVANEDNIGTMVRIRQLKDLRDNAKLVKPYGLSWDMNNSYIRMNAADANGIDRYQVLDRTNVFVMDVDPVTYAVSSIEGTTVNNVVKTAKPGSKIVAYVLTDADIDALVKGRVISYRNRITDKKDIAHTVIFFDTGFKYSCDYETMLVTNVYTATSPHSVRGQSPDNIVDGKEFIDRNATPWVSLTTMNTDDIVSLELTKDEDKLIQDWSVLIPSNLVKTNSYKVVGGDINYSKVDYRRLDLEDANGNVITKWLVRGAEEFGTITIDSVITFHEDDNYDIDVIRVYPKNTRVTANAKAAVPTHAVLEKLLADNIVQIKGKDGITKLYQYAGDANKDLATFVGKEITFEIQVLNGVEYIYNIALVEVAPK